MGYHESDGHYRRTQQKYETINGGWILAAGTPLAAFSGGDSVTPGLALDNSEFKGIRWNNHATPAAVFNEWTLPKDRAPNTDIIVHLRASKSGATEADATTFDVGAFFQEVGSLHDADATAGGATDAMVGTATAKTVQHVSRTIEAADIPNSDYAAMTLSVKPTADLLDTDDVTIQVFLEYTAVDLGV